MKRRPFLQKLSALGVTTALLKNNSTFASESQLTSDLSTEEYLEQNLASKTILKTLENEHIKFDWFSDASANILIKKTNITWNMGNVAYQEDDEIDRGHVWVRQDRSVCEQYPGKFSGVADGENVKFILLNRGNKIMGNFTVSVKLDKDSLVINVKNIDEKIPNLSFPPPIINESLVIPSGAGKLIRNPIYTASYQTFYSHLNMRFFGGLNKENGYLAIFEDGFEDAGALFMQMSATAVWQKSLGKYQGSRQLRYNFTSGGYVGIAKKYRNWFISKGYFKSLKDKIAENPNLNNLVGGRLISMVAAWPKRRKDIDQDKLRFNVDEKSYTEQMRTGGVKFSEMPSVIKQCQEAGMKKGVFNIRGWIKGGYDYSHPDVWPPESSCGTVNELINVGESTPSQYTVVLHDNYQDTYEHNPSFPAGININKKGNLMLGGYWAPGQSYILNSKKSVEFAKRNWENIKTLKPKGMFIDTITAMQFYESFEPSNLQSRKMDNEGKQQLMQFFKSQKQLLGSEESADFGIKYVDWLENRHSRTVGETIPLWSLVFHDAVMNGRYSNNPVTNAKNEPNQKPTWLEDLLWGYFMLYWSANQEQNDAQYKAIQNTVHVDEWFGQIATAEMTNHEFLTDDFEVEKTTFNNGKSIIVNFSSETKTVLGVVINAFGYKIV